MPIPQTKQRDIVCRILAEQRKHPVGFFWLQGRCTCIPAGGDAEQAWHCTKHRAHFINWLINQSICLLSSSGPPGFCTTHASLQRVCSEPAARVCGWAPGPIGHRASRKRKRRRKNEERRLPGLRRSGDHESGREAPESAVSESRWMQVAAVSWLSCLRDAEITGCRAKSWLRRDR